MSLFHGFEFSKLTLAIILGASLHLNFGLLFNQSDSLPGKVFLIIKGSIPARGELFAFRTAETPNWLRLPKGTLFVKVASGVPGDRVLMNSQRQIWIEGRHLGAAKEKSLNGRMLEASKGGLLFPGEFFATSPHVDSLDSRYAAIGTVKQKQIVGKARVLF